MNLKKYEADNCVKLSIFLLNKNKCLTNGCMGSTDWSCSGVKSLTYAYCTLLTSDRTSFFLLNPVTDRGFEFKLTNTSCNYGGKRWWFICPLSACNKRIGVLYKPPHCNHWACRHCNNLSYRSSKLSGRHKKFGNYLSIPELKVLDESLKKRFYNGDLTKGYKRFLKKREQTFAATEANIQRLEKIIAKHKEKKLTMNKKAS